jgi:hypothetical protein
MNQKIKISQLPAKGSNLAADDLIEVAEFTGTGYVSKSITGQEIIDAAVGNVDWGDIGGTLSAQTDLQNALDAKVPTSRTLTINGVTQDLSADRTYTISTGITIGTTAITSGTVGRVLFEGTGNVVQESGNLFWDNTNGRLGIGTSTPVQKFHVNGVGVFGPGTAGTSYIQMSEGSVSGRLNRITFNDFDGGTSTRGGWLEIGVYNAQIRYGSYNTFFIGSSTRPYRFFMKDGTDNVIISNGTVAPTDAGYLFDVQGTARVSGALTLGNGLTFNLDGSTTRIFNSGQINYQSNVINGTQHNFTNQVGYNTGTIMTISGGGAANPSTTGNMAIQAIGGRMSFASGNATYNAVQVSTSIENTGTYNGIIRGFYYNPAVSGTGYSHFAFHSTSGRVRFEGLPTSPTGLNAGDIYNDGGILKIV